MTDRPRPTAVEREAAIARAKATLAESAGSGAGGAARPAPRRRSTGGKILATGIAASSGLLLVAAMAGAAQADTAGPTAGDTPSVVQRVVVIELPATTTSAPAATTAAPAPPEEVTVVREVRTIPAPPQEPAPAPAPTQGS